jgi:tetratricopeptide (TPR) repeat protein
LSEIPASLLRAEAWNLKGDAAHARQSYIDARATLQAAVRREPDNPDLWSALGVAEAGLGEKDAALRDGRHATQLVPVSEDVFAGPFYLAALAQIYARLGEPDQAVKLLARLLAIPAGRVVSVPLLRLDPGWDSIRHDPGFQALLKRYGNRAPVPASVAASATALR